MNKKIKVFIVDDSLLFRKMLIENLSAYGDIEVIGYAIDAFDAMRKIPVLKPDVVTTDVEMPGMTGIEFLKQLIPKYPVPVILCSSLNLSVFDALSAGAIDFVRKPDNVKIKVPTFIINLITKIKIASVAKVKVPTQPLTPAAEKARTSVVTAKSAIQKSTAPIGDAFLRLTNSSKQLDAFVIAIGASTGGTEATLKVLQNLPADTPGIVVTQHMPEGFTKMYAERLNRICKMQVREAKNGDIIKRGLVLIAPGDFQMRVVKTGAFYSVKCTKEKKVSGHMPSVDVLFDSMADNVYKGMGIILTGMGQDGAKGLLRMRQKGFYTLGQSKESCVVYGMPMEANKLGAVVTEASCEKIPELILSHLNKIV
nr:chemotaxis response regulator protein-glutamate methylesterase [uncultured Anaerotignum sp.]